MNIGVLGTGVVGETIATALTEKGHNVRMGSRTENNEKASAWVSRSNEHATQGTFYDAAAFGELIFICLNGAHALEVVRALARDSIEGKILVDLTNPLDFSHGMPPRLLEGLNNHNSLGEEMQKAAPGSYVVKTLNTVNCHVMVNPKRVNKGDHHLFVCGNDASAKNRVKHFLVDNFGWLPENLLDLGGIEVSRNMEAYVPLWVGIMQALGTADFNIRIVK